MKPYLCQAEITVYSLSGEDAEKKIEEAMRPVEGFDDVTFNLTVSLAEEDQE